MTIDAGPDSARRGLLFGSALTVAGAASTMAERASSGQTPRFAYVGCRTTKERNARGEGIGVHRIDPATGRWSHVQLVRDLVNPSFLAFDRAQRFLYAVHGDMSDISAFRVDPNSGELTFLNRQSTGGRNPVHLTPDESNRFVIVANYATGTMAILPRNSDGSLGAVRLLETLPGEPGPNRTEQTSSHPHEVAWNPQRQFLIVPDKGLDRVFTFRFDPEVGKVVPSSPGFVELRPGAGPRHIAFHPSAPFAFIAQELDSSVGAFAFDSETGTLTPIQVLPSTPETFTGANTAADIEIHPSGRFLFVSNRGHDSIATFAVDAATGRLTPVTWTLSEGRGPRFFTLDAPGGTSTPPTKTATPSCPFPSTCRRVGSAATVTSSRRAVRSASCSQTSDSGRAEAMKLGFVGLGQMGRPIAHNLLKSGAELVVNGRTDRLFAEFRDKGARGTTDPADLAEVDALFLCLPNTEVVQTFLLGEGGLAERLHKGQTVVDLSTIAYGATVEISRALDTKGIAFLDAPISGMEARAIDGTLTVMCGGERAVFDGVRPLLDLIGSKILYMGPAGSGQLTKLINQLLFDINAAALGEVLPMAVKMVLDPDLVGEVVNSGTGRSYASEFFIPRILRGHFSDGYPMAHAYKDLVSGIELGANHRVPMPVLAAATATYQAALLQGHGENDKGAMVRVFEQLLGVEFRSKATQS